MRLSRQLLSRAREGRCTVSRDEEELRRLINLRAKQIETRDPQARARELHGRISERQRRRQKRFGLRALGEEIRAVPKKWQGMVIGGALGFAVLIGLRVFVESETTTLVGVAAIIVLAFVGLLFGMAFEWRDEISELGKG